MNKIFNTCLTALALLLTATGAFAQDSTRVAANAPVEMATGLYQSGKIYVVVTVAAIIAAGIIAYLVALDRKITRLEKEINNTGK